MIPARMRINVMNKRLVCANPEFPAKKAQFTQNDSVQRTYRLRFGVTSARQFIVIMEKNTPEKRHFLFFLNGTLLAPSSSRDPIFGTRTLTAAEPDGLRH